MRKKKSMLGKRIQVIRTVKGIKQEDLARATGISQSTMSRIEGGQLKPDFELVEDFADELKCSLLDFSRKKDGNGAWSVTITPA